MEKLMNLPQVPQLVSEPDHKLGYKTQAEPTILTTTVHCF